MRNILNKMMVDACMTSFNRRVPFTHSAEGTLMDPADISEFMHIFRKDVCRVNSVCRCLQKLKSPLFKDVQIEKTVCQFNRNYEDNDDHAASYYKVFEEVQIEKFLSDWNLVGRVIIDAVMWEPGSIAEDYEPAVFFMFVGYLESRMMKEIRDSGIIIPIKVEVEDNEYWDHSNTPTSEQILRVPDLLEDEIMDDIEQSFENLKKLKM